MDRRLPIVRMCLTCLVAAVWWYIGPPSEMQLILFGAGVGFMPGCGCWCEEEEEPDGPTGCGRCSGFSWLTYQVSISGVTNMGAECGDCDTNYNGTFEVVHWFGPTLGTCGWRLTGLSFCAGTAQTTTTLELNISLSGVQVRFVNNVSTPMLAWFQSISAPNTIECVTLSGYSVPVQGGSSTGCDDSASTCLVSAL
jgi:hypothetical protein